MSFCMSQHDNHSSLLREEQAGVEMLCRFTKNRITVLTDSPSLEPFFGFCSGYSLSKRVWTEPPNGKGLEGTPDQPPPTAASLQQDAQESVLAGLNISRGGGSSTSLGSLCQGSQPFPIARCSRPRPPLQPSTGLSSSSLCALSWAPAAACPGQSRRRIRINSLACCPHRAVEGL